MAWKVGDPLVPYFARSPRKICKNSLELSRPNVDNEVHEHAPQILVQG